MRNILNSRIANAAAVLLLGACSAADDCPPIGEWRRPWTGDACGVSDEYFRSLDQHRDCFTLNDDTSPDGCAFHKDLQCGQLRVKQWVDPRARVARQTVTTSDGCTFVLEGPLR